MSVKVTGINQTEEIFEKLFEASDEMLDAAMKAGANVVADEMRSQIHSLKTSDEYQGGNGKKYCSQEDKKGLLDSMGYTGVRTKSGIKDVNVGFDGYNKHITKKYPKGHANQMIANAINKGTSFLIAQPFINKTKNKTKQSAVDAMLNSVDSSIKKIEI